MLFISSFESVNVAIPDQNICLWMTASVPDTAVVKPNGIKTILASGLSKFFIKGYPVFSNGSKNLPKNPPDCPILCIWVFDSFVLAKELFGKALGSLKTCVLVNNNLCRKLLSTLELPTTFDESFKVTSLPFFIPDID